MLEFAEFIERLSIAPEESSIGFAAERLRSIKIFTVVVDRSPVSIASTVVERHFKVSNSIGSEVVIFCKPPLNLLTKIVTNGVGFACLEKVSVTGIQWSTFWLVQLVIEI